MKQISVARMATASRYLRGTARNRAPVCARWSVERCLKLCD